MVNVKPYLDHDALVEGLVATGVSIPDREQAKVQLQKYGYHRLSGYRYLHRVQLPPDQQDPSSRRFRSKEDVPGTSLCDVIDLAEFDVRLRCVLESGIEDFEIRLRTAVAHVIARRSELGHLYVEHLDEKHCLKRPRNSSKTSHEIFLQQVNEATDLAHRRNDDFVIHHRQMYGRDLPVWAVVEYLTFGSLVFLLDYLKAEDKRSVANTFGASHPAQFVKWVRAIGTLRNDVAHAVRLFNKPLKNEIAIPPHSCTNPLLTETAGHLRVNSTLPESRRPSKRIYSHSAVLSYLLRSHPAGSEWWREFRDVSSTFPRHSAVPLSPEENMGFPAGWKSDPLWN